jgi:hypothetical protein
MKDIARIIEAMSAEEAEARPIQTRYVKDIVLMNLWPAVIRNFYPNTYGYKDALYEMHLDYFEDYERQRAQFRQSWIDYTMKILEAWADYMGGVVPIEIRALTLEIAERALEYFLP